jgi:hypothetical protein
VGTATVVFNTANGTATAGTDYTASSVTLTFKPGETNKTVAVKVTNDTAAESDETLTATISSPSGEATLSTNTVTTVTIVDNDFGFADVFGSVDPVRIVSLGWDANGLPTVTVGGPIGSYAIVDVTSDLETWEEIGAQPLATGVFQVTDSAATTTGGRFYRLRAPADETSTQ